MVNVAVINIKSLIKILLIIFVVIFFIYFVQGLSINLDKFAFSPFILYMFFYSISFVFSLQVAFFIR